MSEIVIIQNEQAIKVIAIGENEFSVIVEEGSPIKVNIVGTDSAIIRGEIESILNNTVLDGGYI